MLNGMPATTVGVDYPRGGNNPTTGEPYEARLKYGRQMHLFTDEELASSSSGDPSTKDEQEDKQKKQKPQTCDAVIGCSWEELGCDLQVEDERLYCFALKIHGNLWINDIPDSVLRLEINDNSITSIDPRTFDSTRGTLQVLHAQNNQLGSNGGGMQLLDMFGRYNATHVFPNMTRLDLSNNQLIAVESNLLAGIPLLQTLYMHFNPDLTRRCDLTALSDLETVLFDVCLGTNVDGCSALSLGCAKGTGWISCQNKDISGTLWLNDDMAEVTHLYLQKNAITLLHPLMFEHATKMEMISVENNQLAMISVDLFNGMMPKLRAFKVKGNDAISNEGYTCPNKDHRRKKMTMGDKSNPPFFVCANSDGNDL